MQVLVHKGNLAVCGGSETTEWNVCRSELMCWCCCTSVVAVNDPADIAVFEGCSPRTKWCFGDTSYWMFPQYSPPGTGSHSRQHCLPASWDAACRRGWGLTQLFFFSFHQLASNSVSESSDYGVEQEKTGPLTTASEWCHKIKDWVGGPCSRRFTHKVVAHQLQVEA